MTHVYFKFLKETDNFSMDMDVVPRKDDYISFFCEKANGTVTALVNKVTHYPKAGYVKVVVTKQT